MANDLLKVEYESTSGIQVALDVETVANYCTRGNGKISDQEVALFLRTCQAKRLDPLENGEIYLIKYDDKSPAQMVVGRHAYNRRADRHPDYRGKKSGITVFRDNQIIQKEGCCVYTVLNERLIGGWCRVFRQRAGSNAIEEIYREVALEEYSSGMANWKSKPATMIEKVAVSQCLRDAFPNEYEGLYSEDEMVASGAIPVEFTETQEKTKLSEGEPQEKQATEDPAITKEQRNALFDLARKHFGEEESNEILKTILSEFGLESTKGMKVSVYGQVMASLYETIKERAAETGD